MSDTHDEGPLAADEVDDLEQPLQLFTADGLVRLSYSAIDTYANCPAKYRYGYVFRMPGRSAPPLAMGTAVHHALERFHQPGLATIPSEDDLREWLREAWDEGAFTSSPMGEEDDYKRAAWRAVTNYRRRAEPTWRPAVGTEVWFEVPIGGVANLVGSIDRLDLDADGGFHVVDYKTNRRVSTRQRVAANLQLSLYALAVEHAFNRLPATVALDFVVVGERVEVGVDELDLDGARQAVVSTAEAIRAEEFGPTPNPLCDWCDFKSICPAWTGVPDGEPTFGRATAEVRALRRQLRADLRTLREKEAALESLRRETGERADQQAGPLAEQAQARAQQAREAASADPTGPAGGTDDAGVTLLDDLAP